jgi:hypothetical protein
LTKDLEGNYNLKDGAWKASYRALWEVLPVFKFILSHFKKLEREAKGDIFNYHPNI